MDKQSTPDNNTKVKYYEQTTDTKESGWRRASISGQRRLKNSLFFSQRSGTKIVTWEKEIEMDGMFLVGEFVFIG